MTGTEQIYDRLQRSGVCIFACKLGARKSICSEDGYMGVNDALFEDEADRYTDAIHNEGHYIAGAFYREDAGYQVREQAEYRADKAAALEHIPPEKLLPYIIRGASVWEIAEAFGVTDEFVWRAFTIYKENLGLFAG